MSSTVFVVKILSSVSPFHITRNLILTEEWGPENCTAGVETFAGRYFWDKSDLTFLIMMVSLRFFRYWEEFGSKVNHCMNLGWLMAVKHKIGDKSGL